MEHNNEIGLKRQKVFPIQKPKIQKRVKRQKELQIRSPRLK